MKNKITEIIKKYVKDGTVHGLLINELTEATKPKLTAKTRQPKPKPMDELFDAIEANDGIVIARIEGYPDTPKIVIEAATWAKISEFRRLQRQERKLNKLRDDLIKAGFPFDDDGRLPASIEKTVK